MTMPKTGLDIRTSPHIQAATPVDVIMRHVVYALLPVCAFAVYQFGLSAFLLILVCTGACLLTEHTAWWLARHANARDSASPIRDGSAVVTGILLALTLPPGFPLWMAFVGGVFAITLGKVVFGGIGFNVFNPALVGRAFLQATFPVAITTWTPVQVPDRFTSLIPSTLSTPFLQPLSVVAWVKNVSVDGFSGATPLALQKFDHISTNTVDLLTGMTAGSAGETSALLILICGAYLIARRMMDWRIPAGMLGSAFITGGLFYLADPEQYPDPVFILFSGGLILGALFMASDMVGSPVTSLGVWIYGALMGFLTVFIRLKGGLPEGVMYAILLGNAMSPIIDGLTQPRIYGQRKNLAVRKDEKKTE